MLHFFPRCVNVMFVAKCIDARRKRPPKRLSQRPNDIYVNRKSDFASQLARSHKLLDQGYIKHFTLYIMMSLVHERIVHRSCSSTDWGLPYTEP